VNVVTKYSTTLKSLKKEYKKVSLNLRKTRLTKEACEDAGYLIYYPHIIEDISKLSDDHRIIRKDIRVYSKLLKEEIRNVRSV
jgi:hypothetical protein